MNISFNTIYNNYYLPAFTAKTPKINVKKSELAQYLEEGKSSDELAEIYKASKIWVNRTIKRLGLDSTKDIKRKKLDELMPSLLEKNATMQEMEEKTGASRTTISLWIRSNRGKTSQKMKREKYVELFKMNLSDAEIAQKLNTNIERIRERRYRYAYDINGIKSQKHQRKEAQLQTFRQNGNFILERVKNGASLEEAAGEIGISKDYAYKILRQIGIQDEVHRAIISNKNIKKANAVMEKVNSSNIKKAAEDLNYSEQTTYHYVKIADSNSVFHKNRIWDRNKEKYEFCMQQHKSGKSFEEIAEELNVSVHTVKRYLRLHQEHSRNP